MAAIDQRPNGWRLRWRNGGKRTDSQLNLRFPTEELALRAQKLVEGHGGLIEKEVVWATVMGLDLPTDEPEPAKPKLPTVAELIEPFLKSKLNVEPGSIRKYRQQLNFGLVPICGDVPIDEVTNAHITDVINRLKKCDCADGVPGDVCTASTKDTRKPHSHGFQKRTIDRYFAAMTGYFHYTMDANLRTTSPMKGVQWKPQGLNKYNAGRKEDDHFYMTKAQYKILRSHFDPRYQPMLDFMVETGLRFGELTALVVEGIKRDAKPHPQVVVDRAWKEDEQGRSYVGDPKGGAPRTIRVKAALIKRIQPFLEGKKPTDLVFPAPQGGRWDDSNFNRRIWTPAVRAAMRCDLHPVPDRGTPTDPKNLAGPRCCDNGGTNDRGDECRSFVRKGYDRCSFHCGPDPKAASECECWGRRLPKAPTPHDCRHTHAAWLIAAGNISLKAISVRLGHSTVQLTETVYAGLLEEIDDRIVEASGFDEDEFDAAA